MNSQTPEHSGSHRVANPRRAPPNRPVNMSQYEEGGDNPLTSPENIDLTRQRLSKLLSREKALRNKLENRSDEDVTLSRGIDEYSQPAQVRQRSPIRNSAKHSSPVRQAVPFRRAVSSSPVRGIHEIADSYSERVINDESIFNGLDANRFNDAFLRTNFYHSQILQLISTEDIMRTMRQVEEDLELFGICGVQLWIAHTSGSLWTLRTDDFKVTMHHELSARLLDETNNAPLFSMAPKDSVWPSLVTAIKAANRSESSSGNLFWKCIHCLRCPLEEWSGYSGLLVVPESLNAAVTISMISRSRFGNASQIKILFALQCLQHLAAVVASRLNTLLNSNGRNFRSPDGTASGEEVVRDSLEIDISNKMRGCMASLCGSAGSSLGAVAGAVALAGVSVLGCRKSWTILQSTASGGSLDPASPHKYHGSSSSSSRSAGYLVHMGGRNRLPKLSKKTHIFFGHKRSLESGTHPDEVMQSTCIIDGSTASASILSLETATKPWIQNVLIEDLVALGLIDAADEEYKSPSSYIPLMSLPIPMATATPTSASVDGSAFLAGGTDTSGYSSNRFVGSLLLLLPSSGDRMDPSIGVVAPSSSGNIRNEVIASFARDLVDAAGRVCAQVLAHAAQKYLHCLAKAPSAILQLCTHKLTLAVRTQPTAAVRPALASVVQYMETLQIDGVAHCLGARRSVLLLTDQFASTLQMRDSPTDIQHISSLLFLSPTDAALRKVTHDHIDPMQSRVKSGPMSWLQQIRDGSPLILSSSAFIGPRTTTAASAATAATVAAALPPIMSSGTAAVERESGTAGMGMFSARAQVAQQDDSEYADYLYAEESRVFLVDTIHSIDASATTAALVPIRTRYGLAILLLIDKVEPRSLDTGAISSPTRGYNVHVSIGNPTGDHSSRLLSEYSPDDTALLRSSNISAELCNALEIIIAAGEAQTAAQAVARSRLAVSALGEALAQQRLRHLASATFAKWHLLTSLQVEKKVKSTSGSLLACALDLLRARRDSPAGRREAGGIGGGSFDYDYDYDYDDNEGQEYDRSGVPVRVAGRRMRAGAGAGGSHAPGGNRSFFSIAESQASRMFPADAVVLSQQRYNLLDVASIAASGADDIVTIVNLQTPTGGIIRADESSEIRRGRTSITADSTSERILIRPQVFNPEGRGHRHVLVGVIKYREALSAVDMMSETVAIGVIRITRARGNGRNSRAALSSSSSTSASPTAAGPFSLVEVNTLSQLCELLSDVYTAIRRGNSYDFGDGDAQGLSIPALSQIVPLLLDASLKGPEDLSAVFSTVASWAKRLCGSDVALVKLLAHSIGSVPGGDTVISSDDRTAHSMSRSEGRGNSSGAGAHSRPGLDEQSHLHPHSHSHSQSQSNSRRDGGLGFDSRTGQTPASLQDLIFEVTSLSHRGIEDMDASLDHAEAGPRMGSGADKIVLKLLKSVEDNTVVGELKVVGSKGAFDFQHVSVLRIICYIIAHTIMANKKFKHLEGVVMKAHDTIKQLESVLQACNQDLGSERANGSLMRKRLSSALALVVFMTKAAEASTPAHLGALVSDALPSVFGAHTVVLYILDEEDDSSGGTSDDARFVSMCPPSRAPNRQQSTVSAEATRHADPARLMTLAQITSLPSFTDRPTASQSRHLLHRVASGKGGRPGGGGDAQVYGAVLFWKDSDVSVLDSSASQSATSISASSSSPGRSDRHVWSGLEEILMTAVNSCLSISISKVEVTASVTKIKHALQDTELLQRDRSRLEEELIALMNTKRQLDEENNQLLNEVDRLCYSLSQAEEQHGKITQRAADEVHVITHKANEQSDRLRDKIATLEREVESLEHDKNYSQEEKEELLQVVLSFAYDSRCSQSTVMQWLGDYADAKHASVATVGQGEGGALFGPKLEKMRGVMAAAGEALRTGAPVEIFTSFATSSSSFAFGGDMQDEFSGLSSTAVRSSGGISKSKVAGASSRADGTREGGGEGDAGYFLAASAVDMVAVLCVPNRCVTQTTRTEHACFVFARPSKSKAEGFSLAEKNILNSVASLAGSVLARVSVKYNADDFHRIESEAQLERFKLFKLRSAISISESAWQRGCKNRSDIGAVIEAGILSLLSRGPRDPCVVETFFWFPSWSTTLNGGLSKQHSGATTAWGEGDGGTGTGTGGRGGGGGGGVYPVLSQHGLAGEVDLVSRVLSSAECVRKVSVMWVPLKTPDGNVVALLRIERKIASNVTISVESDNSSGSGDGGSGSGSGSGRDSGRRATSTAASTSLRPYNARDSDAPARVKQFSFSGPPLQPTLNDLLMTEDEEEVVAMFARLSFPLLDRLTFVAEAYSGVQQAGLAITALQSVQAGLEGRLALEVAHRLEFEDALKAGIDMLGLCNSKRVITSQLLDCARRSFLSVLSAEDCFLMFPSLSDVFTPTLLNSLKSKQAHSVGGTDDDEDGNDDFGSGRSTIEQLFTFDSDRPDPIRVRLHRGDLESTAVQHGCAMFAPAADEGTVSTGVGIGRPHSSWSARRVMSKYQLSSHRDLHALYSLAVPLDLRNGHQAVVTVLRRSAPFTGADKDSVVWIGRVLVYCLQIRGGDDNREETQKMIVDLQDEVERLRSVDIRCQQEVAEREALERSLCMPTKSSHLLSSLSEAAEKQQQQQQQQRGLSQPMEGDDGGVSCLMDCANIVVGTGLLVSLASDVEINRGAQKVVVQTISGKIEFWNEVDDDRDSHLVASGTLTSHRGSSQRRHQSRSAAAAAAAPGAKASRKGSSTGRTVRSHSADSSDTAAGERTLLFFVQHRSFPATWLQVPLEDPSDKWSEGTWRLRFAMLMQLLDSLEPWRSRLGEKEEELHKAIHRNDLIAQQLEDVQESHQEQVQELQLARQCQLESTQHDLQLILEQRSAHFNNAERILCTALTACSTLRDSLLTRVPKTHRGRNESLQAALTSMCQVMSKASQCDVGIGSVRMLSSRAEGGATDAILSTPDFDIQWFDTDASESDFVRGSKHLFPSTSAAASSSPYASMRIRRDDPIFTSISTGHTVVICASGDGEQLNSAIARMSKLLTKGALKAEMDRLSDGRSTTSEASLQSSVTVVPVTHGYPSGTVVVPIHLSARGSTLVVVMKPTVSRGDSLGDRQLSDGRQGTVQEDRSGDGGDYDPSAARMTVSTVAVVLGAWHILTATVQSTVADFDKSATHRDKAFQSFAHALVSPLQNRYMAIRSAAHAFELLKTHALRGRLATALAEGAHNILVRKKVRRLEKSMADWTELVKGMNGASGGVAHGLGGLWAQACRTLISMMGSHIALKGCGLLVKEQGARDEIVDYSVRELSTPYVGNKYASSEELPDYARGMLEVRPAEDLGARVHALAFDLFEGRNNLQRLIKLTRQEEGNVRLSQPQLQRSAGEELWLVPIRTARTVLAILRINIDVSLSSIATSDIRSRRLRSGGGGAGVYQMRSLDDGAMMDATPIQSRGGVRGGAPLPTGALSVEPDEDAALDLDDSIESSDSSDSQSRLDAAQNTAINFAEVIAPIIAASMHVQLAKSSVVEREEMLRAQGAKYKAVADDSAVSVQRLSLLSNAVTAIGEVAAAMVGVGGGRPAGATTTSGASDMPALVRSLSIALGRVLDAGVEIDIFSAGASGGDEVEGHSAHSGKGDSVTSRRRGTGSGSGSGSEKGRNIVSEPLADSAGRTIGIITITVTSYGHQPASASSTASLTAEASHHDARRNLSVGFAGADGSNITSGTGTGVGGGGVAGRTTSEEDKGILAVALKSRVSAIKAVVKPLARALSGLLCSFLRECETALQVQRASNGMRLLEEALEDERVTAATLRRKESEIKQSADFYRALADIINQCLQNVAGESSGVEIKPSLTTTQLLMQTPGAGATNVAHTSLSILLRDLCIKLPSLIGSASVFSFATLDDADIGDYMTDGGRLFAGDVGHGTLVWYYAHEGAQVARGLQLDDSTREITDNLARACISKRTKSAVDVGLRDGESLSAGSASSSTAAASALDGAMVGGIRVLNYPLLNGANTAAVGCMQVLLRSALNATDLDGLFEDVTRAVSCVVFEERRRKFSSHRLVSLEEDVVVIESQKEEAETMRTAWQQRAEAWRGVSLMATEVCQKSSQGVPLVEMLESESLTLSLMSSGIHLSVRSSGESAANSATLRFDGLQSNVQPQVRISLDDNSDTVLEISYHPQRAMGRTHGFSGAAGDGIASISSDLIEAVSAVSRSAVGIHKLKSSEAVEAVRKSSHVVHKAEKIKTELKLARAELATALEKRAAVIADLQLQGDKYSRLHHLASSTVTSFCVPVVSEVMSTLEESGLAVTAEAVEGKKTEKIGRGHGRSSGSQEAMWDDLSRVADRAMTRVINRSFDYHVSVLVRQQDSENSAGQEGGRRSGGGGGNTGQIHLRVHLPARGAGPGSSKPVFVIGGHGVSYGNPVKYDRLLSHQSLLESSILEKCIRSGTTQEVVGTTQAVDLIGLSPAELASILDSGKKGAVVVGRGSSSGGGREPSAHADVLAGVSVGVVVQVICVPLLEPNGDVTGILRLVFPSDADERDSATRRGESMEHKQGEVALGLPLPLSDDVSYSFSRSLVRPMLEMVAHLGSAFMRINQRHAAQVNSLAASLHSMDDNKAHAEVIQQQLSRTRRMHRVVCREASVLLDPPMVAGGATGQDMRAAHPASLSPLAASQDVCLKLLTMLRTLLRGEGQALLIRDPSTEPVSYQVMYTGNALSWMGVEQGVFGVVSSSQGRTSLVETVLHSHKSLAIGDATKDSRHSPSLDGICSPGTPLVLVPLRGRGGAVVGVLLSARGKGGESFQTEDVVAAEMASSFGSVSLYWCQGMGTLHHKLSKNLNKMDQLEKAMRAMETGRKSSK